MNQLDRIEQLLGDVLAEIREHRREAWKWKFSAAMDRLDGAIAQQRSEVKAYSCLHDILK